MIYFYKVICHRSSGDVEKILIRKTRMSFQDQMFMHYSILDVYEIETLGM